MIDLSEAVWRKSSRSGGQSGGQCVEVAGNLPDVVVVRDSKDPVGPSLVVAPATWTSFATRVRTDFR